MVKPNDHAEEAKTEAALQRYQERKRYTDWVAKKCHQLCARTTIMRMGVPVHDDQKLFRVVIP
ncbi:hypothetical protein ACVFZR_06130 [Lacticaseibacillus paracasei]